MNILTNLRRFIIFSLFLGQSLSANAQDCNPDTQGPIVNCNNISTYLAIAGEEILIPADFVVAGVSDNCTAPEDIQFFISTDIFQTTVSTTTTLVFPAGTTGDFGVKVWAVDEAGLFASCWGTLSILDWAANCQDDVTAPIVVCESTIDLEYSTQEQIIQATDLDNGSYDLCTASENLSFFVTQDLDITVIPTTTTTTIPADTSGVFPVALWVIDEAGNTNFCVVDINVSGLNPACENDTTPPIAICSVELELAYSTQEQIIQATDLNNGSYDLCTSSENLSLFATLDWQATAIPNTTFITIPADTIGTFVTAFWVIDEAGNANFCIININVNGSSTNCENDTTAPVAVCESTIELEFSTEDQIIQAITFDNGSNDLCTAPEDLSFFVTLDLDITVIPTTTSIIVAAETTGTLTVALWVIDEAGNANQCFVDINVAGPPGDCQNDVLAPVVLCNSLGVDFPPNFSTEIPAHFFNDGSWDNCTAEENLQFFISADSTLTSPPNTQIIALPANVDTLIIVNLWVVDEAGNYASCQTYINIIQTQTVFGKIFNDENQNCELDQNEIGIPNYAVRYTYDNGLSYHTSLSNAAGEYHILSFLTMAGLPGFPDLFSEITLELMLPNGNSSSCVSSVTLPLPLDPETEVNFPLELATDCQSMFVDIAAPFLRRCFPTTYTTTYCNNSAFAINDVEIVVTLAEEMVIEFVGLPYTNLGNNQLLFEIDTVEAGSCAQFPIKVILDCDTPLGATKCVQAAISPNDCQVPDPSWSGAHLVVTGECEEGTNEVKFKIENIGTGPMQEAKPAIVIEDVIMYQYDPVQLGPGEFEELSFAANGSTWRVQIPQEFGHPSISTPMAVIEGCGGFGSMGYINQFPMPEQDPYIAIDCQEVIGSFDPNDKSAFPTGYGMENMVETNTSLEYKIRFQNTGTDTAFTVRLEDVLSEYLDYSTIVPGSSSHPYRMELQPDSILVFHFENINLPDSTTDESGSHGFIQFRVNQNPDNPIGTVIENQAGIYFDFNEPILTNTVFHTIGEISLISANSTIFDPNLKISILPNPFDQTTQFKLEGWQGKQGTFELYDVLGQLKRVENFSEKDFNFYREELAAGTYFYQLRSDQKVLATGKLLIN